MPKYDDGGLVMLNRFSSYLAKVDLNAVGIFHASKLTVDT